uniref:Bug family tripartite tricarboxylate transporter substrate binding protein n=1 Tax=Bartonella sp. TT121SHDZB TaxID=3243580 RepID=UPI0035D05BD9
PHMSSEMFRQKAGIEVTLVPFPGAAPAVTALLGQQVDYMIDNLPSSMPHIRSGKFRALAITSATRSAPLPEGPTRTEAGVPMQVTAWFGLLAPAGTPDAVVERIQQSARRAMQTAEGRQRFADLGGVPGGETPAEYDAFIAQERKSWAQIVKAAGLSLE